MATIDLFWDPLADTVYSLDTDGATQTLVPARGKWDPGEVLVSPTGTSLFVRDQLGNNRGEWSSTLADTQTFDPFGNPETGALDSIFGFAADVGGISVLGGEAVYLRQRVYDPSTSSWLTPDPLGYSIDHALYQYANSSPTTEKDPTGLLSYSTLNPRGHRNRCGHIWWKIDWEVGDEEDFPGLIVQEMKTSILVVPCEKTPDCECHSCKRNADGELDGEEVPTTPYTEIWGVKRNETVVAFFCEGQRADANRKGTGTDLWCFFYTGIYASDSGTDAFTCGDIAYEGSAFYVPIDADTENALSDFVFSRDGGFAGALLSREGGAPAELSQDRDRVERSLSFSWQCCGGRKHDECCSSTTAILPADDTDRHRPRASEGGCTQPSSTCGEGEDICKKKKVDLSELA